MHYIIILFILPLFLCAPSFSYDLEHLRRNFFEKKNLEKVLNLSVINSTSSSLTPHAVDFLPKILDNHHPTEKECFHKENCGGNCNGLCVPCLLNGELGWKCLKEMERPRLEEP